MPEPIPRRRLDQPFLGRRRFEVDPDVFARLSERGSHAFSGRAASWPSRPSLWSRGSR